MSTVSNNQNDVVISKTHLNIGALLASILVIALVITSYKLLQGPVALRTDVIRNGVSVPNDSNLKLFLEKRKFNLSVHVNDDGSIKPVNTDGTEKARCGIIRKKGKVLTVFPISDAPSSCPTISEQGVVLRIVGKIELLKVNPICIPNGPYLIC